MASARPKPVGMLDWTEIEHALTASVSDEATLAQSEALRAYFGDAEHAYLCELARRAQVTRARTPVLGNVVVLSGMMGANLVARNAEGDDDLIWVNFLRLARGRIARLKLAPDGNGDADQQYQIRASSVDKRTYARAVLWLKARWNVEAFAYDWRKDIDLASHALAEFIEEKFGGEPLHLVAHSMGGLVARNFVRLYPELWAKMRDPQGSRGGRLIMLGTPNFGSYAVPRAFTGLDKTVRLLAATDLLHSLSQLLEITNTFVSSYQMLPAPSQGPALAQALYQRESWGKFPVSETHLERGRQFHADLNRRETMDPQRMACIAGCGQETVSGVTYKQPGEFDCAVSLDGDGRVTHALGLLPDVPAYFVEEEHGDLPRHEKVLAAIDELLEFGRTAALPDRPIPPQTPLTTPSRTDPDATLMEAHFAAAAQRAQTGTLSAPEQRVLEDILIRVALGQRVPASLLPARNAAATANVASPAFGAAGSGFFDWLRELFGGLRFTPAFAVAATLILAQAGLIGVLLMRETERDQYYETRSAAPQPAPSGPVLEVNFKPESSERDIRLALESVGGSIVDGPGQLGNYIVRVAVGQEAAAARKLGASPVVEAVSVLPNVPAKQ